MKYFSIFCVPCHVLSYPPISSPRSQRLSPGTALVPALAAPILTSYIYQTAITSHSALRLFCYYFPISSNFQVDSSSSHSCRWHTWRSVGRNLGISKSWQGAKPHPTPLPVFDSPFMFPAGRLCFLRKLVDGILVFDSVSLIGDLQALNYLPRNGVWTWGFAGS